MFYSRNKLGQINGAYADPQPFPTEELPDDHAEVVAWRDQPVTPARDVLAELDEAKATIKALLKQGTLTREKIDAEKSEATR